MDYVNLGKSGLKVSRLCLGAMNFGSAANAPTNEADSLAIIDRFLGEGFNFIDTANGYTGGQSEQIVGKAIKSRRDKIVLATKGRSPLGSGPNEGGCSRVHLTRALDASLKRLGTDYVDLYQIHWWDPETPIEETMATLDGFVKAGKVRYIGCSNFTGSQIVEAQWAAARQNGTPFTALQPRYSLVARAIEEDVLPAAERHGLGTLIYSPLGGGLLTGKYKKGEEAPADTRLARGGAFVATFMSQVNDQTYAIIDEVQKIARELDTTPSAVAIAWTLTRRGITCVISGPRTQDQLTDYIAGVRLALPAAAAKRLSDLSKPGGIVRIRQPAPAR